MILSINFCLCLGIWTPVKYNNLLSGCTKNISWIFLCCGVVLLDGKTEKKTIALSKPCDHVIVGGDADVSFSTLLVQSHMFMKTAMVKGRGLWTFIFSRKIVPAPMKH